MLREQAGLGVGGDVLHFLPEGAVTLRYPHAHQVVIVQLGAPQHRGVAEHFGFVGLEKLPGGLLALCIPQVGVQGLPPFPKGTVGKPLHRLKPQGPIGGIFQQPHQQAVIVQGGADEDDIGIAVSCLADRAKEPSGQLFAVFPLAHLFVVFNVVQQDQVGASGAAAAAAELLPAAHGVDAAAVLQQDRAAFPHPPFLGAEGGLDQLVVLQLCLDGIQKGHGLGFGIGDQQDVGFIAVQGGVQHILQAHYGGFSVAAGRGNHQSATLGGPHFGQRIGPGGIFSFHDQHLPLAAKLPMEGRCPTGEVMGQELAAELQGRPGAAEAQGLGGHSCHKGCPCTGPRTGDEPLFMGITPFLLTVAVPGGKR